MKFGYKKIMVAISGSDSSINASKYAIMMAKTYKLELSAIYVVDTATLKELLVSKIFVEDESIEYEKNLELNGKRYLDYVEELAQSKGVKIKKILKHGVIHSKLLETLDEVKPDLILLGGWEESRNKRDLIHRAHINVLRDAECSVLVIKDHNLNEIFKRF